MGGMDERCRWAASDGRPAPSSGGRGRAGQGTPGVPGGASGTRGGRAALGERPGRPAPRPRRPGTRRTAVSGGPPDITGDLEYLENHWGPAYLIGSEGSPYIAERRDGQGATLTAADRDGLAKLIAEDYAASPVPRDL